MPRLSSSDKISLDYIIEAIQRVLSNIENNSLYEYMLDVVGLLQDLKKGRL